MQESLQIPTATSTRVIPVKVLEENRRVINQHLRADYRGKVSFTHLVAWALVQALRKVPAMTVPTTAQILAQQVAALRAAYGFDYDGLDEQWRAYVLKTYPNR